MTAEGSESPWGSARLLWGVPALVTLIVGLIGIGHQVLWQDELSTISAASRPLADLPRLLDVRDAVLGAYYVFMHFWIEVFGSSTAMVRLPSLLAMAIAAGTTALIGSRLFGVRQGLCAGLLFAAVPAVSAFGHEARPYAFALMMATVATLLLLRGFDQPGLLRWGLYGLALVALGYLQLTAIVLVGGHAALVAERHRRLGGDILKGWLITLVPVAVALLPLAIIAAGQTGQIAGIQETSASGIAALPEGLFGTWLVALPVLVLTALTIRTRTREAWLCLALAVIPVALFLIVSLEIPLLRSRYLLFTIFAWLLLAGAAAGRLRPPLAAATVAAIAALGIPAQLEVRADVFVDQHGDQQPDYRAIAGVLEEQVRPGDAIVMPGYRFRVGLDFYTDPVALPDDVLEVKSAAKVGEFDAKECRPAICIGSPERLWVGCAFECTDPLAAIRPETRSVIDAAGYEQVRAWAVKGGAIALYERPG